MLNNKEVVNKLLDVVRAKLQVGAGVAAPSAELTLLTAKELKLVMGKRGRDGCNGAPGSFQAVRMSNSFRKTGWIAFSSSILLSITSKILYTTRSGTALRTASASVSRRLRASSLWNLYVPAGIVALSSAYVLAMNSLKSLGKSRSLTSLALATSCSTAEGMVT